MNTSNSKKSFGDFASGLRAEASRNQAATASIRSVYAAVAEYLANNNLVTDKKYEVTSLSEKSLSKESFVGELNTSIMDTSNPEAALIDLCKACQVTSTEGIQALAPQLALVLSEYEGGKIKTDYFSDSSSNNLRSMNTLYSGSFAARAMPSASQSFAMAREEFGLGVDTTNLDIRLALVITILNYHKSVAARAFNMKSTDSNTIAFKSERFELYDINETSTIGNNILQTVPFINLYQDPSIADIQPKRINVLKSNDASGVYVPADGVIAIGQEVNIIAMSLVPGQIGYNAYDNTDIVNDGVRLESYILTLSKVKGETTTTEQVQLNLLGKQDALLTMGSNGSDANERIATPRGSVIINKNTPIFGTATASTLLTAALPDENYFVQVNYQGSARVRLIDGVTVVTGTVTLTTKRKDGGTVDPAVAAAVNGITFTVSGATLEAYFSEENIRKTTTSMKLVTRQYEYPVPGAKSVIVSFSIQETEPQTVIKGIDELLRIGLDSRSLNAASDVMNVVASREANESMNPDAYRPGSRLIDDYVAGYKSRPFVYTATWDASTVKNIKSSEVMSDTRTKFEYYLMGVLTRIKNKSFFNMQLDAGEKPTYAVVTSPYIYAALLGLPFSHMAMAQLDKESSIGGDDVYEGVVSLPSGDILKVIVTNFQDYQNSMLIFPYRDNKEDDVLSFGTIADRGIFTGTVPAISNNGQSQRFIANTRKQLITTNAVAAKIVVTNLSDAFNS